MKSGIYKITAKHSGEFYIGSSNNISRRWERHRHYFKLNQHQNIFLQRIYNKYGKDNFIYEVVEFIESNKLEEREQYYMDILKPSLNLRLIAKNNTGLKHTDEAKEKMRQAHIGKKLTEEHKQNIGKATRGKPQRKRTEEEKVALRKRSAVLSDEQVYQILWLRWLGLSLSEIARPFNINATTVYKIVNKLRKAYNHVVFNPSIPA